MPAMQTPRCIGFTAVMVSPASRLLQDSVLAGARIDPTSCPARHEAQHANQTRQPPWLLRRRGPGDRNRQPRPGSLRAADLCAP
ncbi:MAG TPA: hypothetical protein DIW86_10565 [Pseudomonas sp.]|nr:hypothetical protein [Pseudomonas sp.]